LVLAAVIARFAVTTGFPAMFQVVAL